MTAPIAATGTVERVFTFGYGHIDPRNGVSLADKCAIIRAKTAADCRKLMIECFGRMWAFEYESIEAAGISDLNWRPEVYIVIDWQAPKTEDVIGLREINGWADRNFPDSWPAMDTATKAEFATRVRKAGREANWAAIFRDVDGKPLAPLVHIWEHRPDGRGISAMQRRCTRCDRWETDDNRDGECVKPKVRVIR